MKIKEIIVVEGKNDRNKILSCIDADVIITNGTHLSKRFLDQCKKMNESRGLIIFTDPDGPGEWIRRNIMAYVGDCAHASLNVSQARAKRKVGIEHADCALIKEALSKRATFVASNRSISKEEFNKLGLTGQKDSRAKRDLLSKKFSFPRSNAKTTLKYLNMMGITMEDCLEVYDEINCK